MTPPSHLSKTPLNSLSIGCLSIKKILVPIDFSAPCRKALQYAIAFAQPFQAKLILVHVVRKVSSTTRVTLDQPSFQRQLKEKGEKLLSATIKKEIQGRVPVDKVIKHGVPFNEIVITANRYNVDIIIIATHGYSGLKHIVMGSTVERVVRHAPCPVLVVREKEREFLTKSNPSS